MFYRVLRVSSTVVFNISMIIYCGPSPIIYILVNICYILGICKNYVIYFNLCRARSSAYIFYFKNLSRSTWTSNSSYPLSYIAISGGKILFLSKSLSTYDYVFLMCKLKYLIKTSKYFLSLSPASFDILTIFFIRRLL